VVPLTNPQPDTVRLRVENWANRGASFGSRSREDTFRAEKCENRYFHTFREINRLWRVEIMGVRRGARVEPYLPKILSGTAGSPLIVCTHCPEAAPSINPARRGCVLSHTCLTHCACTGPSGIQGVDLSGGMDAASFTEQLQVWTESVNR
jgi:hypothetical protein